MAERLSDLERDQIALITRIDERLNSLMSSLDKIERDMSEVKTQMNKWKGALPILIGIGGLLGWLITSFDKIKGLFF